MADSRTFWIAVVCVLLLCGLHIGTHGTSHDDNEVNSGCLEPKYVGPCRAAMPRFYYNKETKSCEQFIFGGCSANKNNFVKKEDCEKTCMGHHSKEKTEDEWELINQ
mgnify:CR=1 FL=1